VIRLLGATSDKQASQQVSNIGPAADLGERPTVVLQQCTSVPRQLCYSGLRPQFAIKLVQERKPVRQGLLNMEGDELSAFWGRCDLLCQAFRWLSSSANCLDEHVI
jgi:hypothetical protein